MGEFKGLINVFTQEMKDNQEKHKKEYIKQIFTAIELIRENKKTTQSEEQKAVKLTFDMLMNQVGRAKFR